MSLHWIARRREVDGLAEQRGLRCKHCHRTAAVPVGATTAECAAIAEAFQDEHAGCRKVELVRERRITAAARRGPWRKP